MASTPSVVAFQFTQPKRAATNLIDIDGVVLNVSIHAAQAGCDAPVTLSQLATHVSIHAAQAGCDDYAFPEFSTLGVSIHAAQAGCDVHFWF